MERSSLWSYYPAAAGRIIACLATLRWYRVNMPTTTTIIIIIIIIINQLNDFYLCSIVFEII
jgi:hypothetical protein